jgi:DNA-binding response OmpR family regulator
MTQDTRILIIEDDPAVGQSLETGLTREGYDVVWKTTGTEGVGYARDHHPHVIILDIRLPDGSGFDFCRQLRAMGLRQPILMLTVRTDETDKVLGLEMGADDYVTKPFSLRELISRIRAHKRRAYGELSSPEADVLYVRDLLIDRGRAQVLRGNEVIVLTPIEFRLFVYLARHQGQAISRVQIVDAVWGHAPLAESDRTVDVHIRRLREKVELNPSQPSLILTVPGVGYRLVP